jgi:hypothetical protein
MGHREHGFELLVLPNDPNALAASDFAELVGSGLERAFLVLVIVGVADGKSLVRLRELVIVLEPGVSGVHGFGSWSGFANQHGMI